MSCDRWEADKDLPTLPLSSSSSPSHHTPTQHKGEHGLCVVVDSLSGLLLHCYAPKICRWLLSCHAHSLSLLHSDLHSDTTLAQFQYIATSSIRLNHTHRPHLSCYTAVSHTAHKRPSGRVLRQVRTASMHVQVS